ncbi:map kinase kinase skh1 pek1 [Colletotrichum asianum]|uniref:Map kinase kinase skh1 pek1 n=1 Tax=Colletotrichum asianum TaxID=702518 RepID=A0A8H3ZDW5_9PEZI|nr:map kinase kinase skh1 pek1 [Colletotrichum asianum]
MDEPHEEPPLSDTTTNPFTSSELAHGLLRAQNNAGSYSHPVSSGDTNAFTSAEIVKRLGSVAQNLDDNTPHDRHQQAHIRIVLHACPEKPLHVKVTPRSSSSAVLRRSVRLDATADSEPGGPAVSTLAITQSEHEMGFRILADSASERPDNPRMMTVGEALDLGVYCDPSGDRMVFVNQQRDSITLRRLADDDENSAVERMMIEILPSTPCFLYPGAWGIFTQGEDLQIIRLSIYPRECFTITDNATETRGRRNLKRTLEASQPEVPVKKVTVVGREPRPQASAAAVLFESVPIPDDTGSAAMLRATLESQHVTASVGHPLEHLRPGARAKITSSQGDYAITYGENIMFARNSLVFKAENTRIPGPTVVKVLRTPSHPVTPGVPDESASKIARTSEMWLKEFKNHSKLSEHVAIIRLHCADARFLSLYIEHVEAPNLASYRSQCGSCTLSVDEAAQILGDMSAAVAYVHGQGIVHNDIKPANILFKPSRGAVLIDFGLSSELKDTAVHVGGSPWYIPPEYALHGRRGAPGDVFALGVVMLFVLGKIPLPDQQRGLNWVIADVRKGGPGNAAWDMMFQWLEKVEHASRSSDGLQHPALNVIVREMLVTVSERISVGDLLRLLGKA